MGVVLELSNSLEEDNDVLICNFQKSDSSNALNENSNRYKEFLDMNIKILS